jgi:predicted TIM-barrel fold metal-dependent hydrolase
MYAPTDPDDHYVVISSDGHGGGRIRDYRDYLASRYHDEFDAWVESFVNPFKDIEGDSGRGNWDSERRWHDLEADGCVAEVIFPNTIPPFFPSVSLTQVVPPADAHTAELRWAGLQAHNRWLADFCAGTPRRRAGVAQIVLFNIEGAVEEIKWTKDAGLSGGVLLPGAPPGSGLPPLHDPVYEPIWQVCEELEVPVNHHGGSASPPMNRSQQEDIVMFLLQVPWWSHQILTHLIVGGVLERHPDMKLVFTEQGTAWVPEQLATLDYYFNRMRFAEGSQEHVWGRPVMDKLPLQPSEYFARNCYIGASFQRPWEAKMRDQVGVDRIMWGNDYPHREASSPFSREQLRLSYGGIEPREVAAMIGGNAARVYDFDLDALQPLADQHCPTVGEVFATLPRSEIPPGADKCPAFAEREHVML